MLKKRHKLPKRVVLFRMRRIVASTCLVWTAACSLLASGCATGYLPRIDPSGERIFVHANQGFTPEPPVFDRCHTHALVLTPYKVVAPVGSEVVLLAGVCGQDGHLSANQRVEWSLSPNEPGTILAVGERTWFDAVLGWRTRPGKVTASYAIGTTSSRYQIVTRGTPNSGDDVPVLRGQAWITVTSPVEGISHVSAFAPTVFGWDTRQQTATIHWVDAQFSFPPPAVNPAGTRHTFTTTVSRFSNQAPVAGWLVRYEIQGGPGAGFSPDGSQVAEIVTDGLGQASVEIFQTTAASGTNPIAIQVFRPADPTNPASERLLVGNGSTNKTWSAAEISLDKSGPAEAAVGSTITYRLTVRNPSDLSARDVVVTDALSNGLTFVSSNPEATIEAAQVVWRLGDLPGGETRTIDVQFRVDKAGTLNNCASVTATDGLSAQDCATTTVLNPSLELRVSNPPQAQVGDDVTFQVNLRNLGNSPADGLTLVARFPESLASSTGARTLERSLAPIQPGQQQQVELTFRAVDAGESCVTVEVQGTASVKTSDRGCVRVVAAPDDGAAADTEPDELPRLTVSKTGPERQKVGDVAQFVILIENVGRVPATNIKVIDHYDDALNPVRARDGFEFVGDDLMWKFPKLEPGKTIRLRVECECTAPADNACNRATVTTGDGVREDAEACLTVEEGPVGLSISIADVADPVDISTQAGYQVRVTNNGQGTARNIRVIFRFPDQLTPLRPGTSGPSRYQVRGKRVEFEAVPELRAGQSLNYRVDAMADRAGKARVVAELSADGQREDQIVEETTTISPRN